MGDGSCCFGCCCGGAGPSPPSPPTPGGGGATYCPDPASDFTADYGSPQWSDNGWTIHGGARASSKASYNLAGGFVEFDMDLGGAHGGVNNNFYITFPSNVGNYCDSGGTGGCAELDFVENNGNCAAATTFHTDPGGGDKGGTQTVNGISSHVHVRAEWDGSGDTLTVHVDGHTISGPGNVGGEMTSRGAVLYSSQWTGWVPGSCGGDHTSTTGANASTNAFYSDANASQSNTIRRLSRRFHGRVFGFVSRRRERIQSVRQRMRYPLRKSRCGCSMSNHLLMHTDIERYLSSRSFHFVH